MKETFFTLFFAAGLLVACSGTTSNNSAHNADNYADSSKAAVIVFKEIEHNFGTVRQGRKARHTFTFENKGTEALVIQSVRTTCGCTVPKYDRRPIAPGRSGKLDVEFDTAGREGVYTQSITINTNATDPVVVLRITAEVTK